MTSISMSDKKTIPQLGYGVWQVGDDQAETAVSLALQAGYRHIDTAAIYRNEAGVGRALKKSELQRSDYFITTKLWNDDQGAIKATEALESSLKKLDLDYVDLYLVHWPAPKKGLYLETWKELIKMKESGKARSIGVSNFTTNQLKEIMDATGEAPVLNQIELHPHFQQNELCAFHQRHGIITECWSPLGQGKILADPVIGKIALKHQKTPAQVILRWHMQNNFVAIPKSVTPSRIQENFDVFDFKLDSDDMGAIERMDSKYGRIGPDPMTADF